MVDDGSPEPAALPAALALPVQILRLPAKTVAKNPCVPFNVGVAAAGGDVIVLTNPEVVHRRPILPGMLERLEVLGPMGYVAAACRAHGRWLCHSTDMPSDRSLGRVPSPPGAGLHFCAMLHRSLYELAGGFDERYRDGQAYEDNDFLWRLERVGAKFEIADDLVCDHVLCPRCEWPKGGAERNREIFNKTWPALVPAVV